MRNLDAVLAAGNVASRFETPCNYFRLMVGTGINVRLYQDRGGTYVARNVDAGFYAQPDPGAVFVAIELDSSVAQTARFFISNGRGGYDRIGASVTVTSGSVAITGTTEVRPLVRYGTSFASVSTHAAGGSTQVFAPASNVNGAIVWAAAGTSMGATAPQLPGMALIAKAGAAPTSFADGSVLTSAGNISWGTGSLAGSANENVNLPAAMFVPSGQGVWWFSVNAELANSARRSTLFTLL